MSEKKSKFLNFEINFDRIFGLPIAKYNFPIFFLIFFLKLYHNF